MTKKVNVNCLIITISDTRTVETDKSGLLIKRLLQEENHVIIDHLIVTDDQQRISEAIDEGVNNESVNVLLLTGGTGISKRDVTIEVVREKLEKELTGFGEIFRMLSYTEDIGSRAIMSRAIAGVVNQKAIFSMPGSSGAVKLAMEKLILPELSHIMYEFNKDK